MNNPNFKIFIINESITASIIKDVFSLGSLLIAFWLNYQYIGSSIIMQIILGTLFFIYIISHGKKSKAIKRTSIKGALKYLQSLDKE